MADVFISYKKADVDKAQGLARAFENAGLSVWWDSQLGAGDEWLRRILTEIKKATSLVGVWTPQCVDTDGLFKNSVTGGHNFLQIEHNKAGRNKVVGAVFDMNAIPVLYEDLQGANLEGWNLTDSSHHGIGQLVDAVRLRMSLNKKSVKIGPIFTEIALEADRAFTPSELSEIRSTALSDSWTIEEAYLAILLSTVFADGKIVQEEQQEIRSIVSRARTLRKKTHQQLAELNMIVNEKLKTNPDSLENACHAVPHDMRLSLFAKSVDLSLVDGEINERERIFLDTIVQNMNLKIEDVRKVLEVCFVKNRF